MTTTENMEHTMRTTGETPVRRGRKPKAIEEIATERPKLIVSVYSVALHIERMAGGFPGHIDALNAFMQLPVMAKRVPAEAREEFLTRESAFDSSVNEGAAERDAQDLYVRTGFRVIDGVYYLMPHQIKAMLQQAIAAVYDMTSRPSQRMLQNAMKMAVSVVPSAIPITITGAVYQQRISQIIKHPRLGTPVPSNRERDIIPIGDVAFQVNVLETVVGRRITAEVLGDLFEVGGAFVGLGTDRGYQFGRFSVTDFQLLKTIPVRDIAGVS